MASTKKEVLMTLTAQAASTNGAAFTLSPKAGCLGAVLVVTAKSGTTPTLDVKIQHSPDGTYWFDLMTFTQVTGVTSLTSSEVKYVASTQTVFDSVRAVTTLGGTDPTWTGFVNLYYDPKP